MYYRVRSAFSLSHSPRLALVVQLHSSHVKKITADICIIWIIKRGERKSSYHDCHRLLPVQVASLVYLSVRVYVVWCACDWWTVFNTMSKKKKKMKKKEEEEERWERMRERKRSKKVGFVIHLQEKGEDEWHLRLTHWQGLMWYKEKGRDEEEESERVCSGLNERKTLTWI